ncbi:MAG: thioredoxin fold domain-containing protein [archaeon]
MSKSTVYLFTSPTCPHCTKAKELIKPYLAKRKDISYTEFSTATEEGKKRAKEYEVQNVPTYIIIGPEYPHPIGLVGVQSENVLNKYVNMSLGISKKKGKNKKGIIDKIKKLFS